MGIFSGCLLLSDIDNTLVYNGTIAKRNVDAIRYFTEQGGLFTIATGRTPSGATDLLDKVAINCPAVCCNGGTIFDLAKGETVSRVNLWQEDQRHVAEIINAHPEFGAEVQNGTDVYIVNDSPVIREHVEYEGIPVILEKAENLLHIPWHKGLMAASGDDVPALMQLAESLKSYPFAHAYVVVTGNGLGTNYLEFHPLESTKSVGALNLKKLVGAKKLFTIGDYYNDIDMLTCADYAAAVAGSPKEVCDAATVTVGSAENGAVADFIEWIQHEEAKQ